jgi:hypothetical protein
MTRTATRIVEGLGCLLLIATVIGIVLVFMAGRHTSHIRHVVDRGTEATARVEKVYYRIYGVTRRHAGPYLKLSWLDSKGSVRTSDEVWISPAFVQRFITGTTIRIGELSIKYLPDAAAGREPVILDDLANRERIDGLAMLWGGGLAAGGAPGSLLMFWLARRRRGAAVQQA